MKKLTLLFVAITLIACYNLNAQGVSINEDGSGFLLPRLSIDELLLIPNPAEGLVVYNTTFQTLNVFNGSDWVDMMGNNLIPKIGDYFRGGVVFYLDGSGGGLICAVSDQSGEYEIEWWNGSYTTTGATATAIGTGQSNTTAIINNQGAGDYAATVCDNYTAGGYEWFLPSKDELNEMYLNKAAINATAAANGGDDFEGTYYWSSTEIDISSVWEQSFSSGNQGSDNKDYLHSVRAVQAY